LTVETPMKFILQPWQLFVVVLASWINRQQKEVIEYLRTESLIHDGDQIARSSNSDFAN
jgi:hypothetical protein